MLEFFRKYQSYIFIVVTIVIVISFSFFGTSSTIVSNPVHDKTVFTAIDGEEIKRHALDEMVLFISTDNYDKQLFGGLWGPNFLNDGVIRKDFLKTGLAEVVANSFLDDLKPDFDTRHEKEKLFIPYKHPQAKFISQESIWEAYAPKKLKSFNALRANNDFHDRVELFLDEMNFPASYSRYLVYSQEKQFNFVSHDNNLDRMDFALFGYHTIQDWFGPRFIRLVAEVIINGAKMAEQKGYSVTKEEALADLIRNSQLSYNENLNNPHLSVANGGEYYNEQLRRLGMDQTLAVNIWRQVLLFRRLFNDIGQSVFVDSLIFQNLNKFASESVTADAYHLPKELQFADYRTMQKFEIYLNLVAKPSREAISLLFPEDVLTAVEVSKRHPELVQKRYLIKLSEVNKNELLSKVSLKKTWNFEVDHFDLFKEKFPELGIKKAETKEERFKALESLDDMTRLRVDTFARNEIVDAHPEWLSEALEKARERTLTVSLGKSGNGSIFEGLVNAEELTKELDKAELNAAPIRFTANQKNYYLITVLDRTRDDEILTFAEANAAGFLDSLLEDKLRIYYQKNKEENNWNSFDLSREAVADAYFEPLLKAIALSSDKQDTINGELLAPLRFYHFMQNSLEQLKKDPAFSEKIVLSNPTFGDPDKLSPKKSIETQWKLQKIESNFTRDAESKQDAFFNLPLNSWSDLIEAPNGDIAFFYLKEKGVSDGNGAYVEKTKAMQSLLADQAKCGYMKKMVEEIQKAHAIALEVPLTSDEE